MSKPQFAYAYIEEVERLDYYKPGGYHPILVGDILHDRYRVVHKLGHGTFSTTWLARDQRIARYVAVKVGTADARQHEANVLNQLSASISQAKGHDDALIPKVLDRFQMKGPNGTHSCLVTNPARCSLNDVREASYSSLFQLPVARALAAQLAIAVHMVHTQGYVHGDLHFGNMLLRMPTGFDNLSIKQLYDTFGAPEPEPVTRLDGGPIPTGVPTHATPPIWLGKPSEEISLLEARLLLIDFGVAFCPSTENRLRSYTPLEIRPPEARFEPTNPLSFASDIWSLACSIWAILGQRPLFESIIATQDDMTAEHVDALGILPPEWWRKWESRSEKFRESGKPVEGRTQWTWDQRFEDSIQEPRRRKGLQTLEVEETAALFELVRWMLAFKPGERPTARQVLDSKWMKKWALPEYKKLLGSS